MYWSQISVLDSLTMKSKLFKFRFWLVFANLCPWNITHNMVNLPCWNTSNEKPRESTCKICFCCVYCPVWMLNNLKRSAKMEVEIQRRNAWRPRPRWVWGLYSTEIHLTSPINFHNFVIFTEYLCGCWELDELIWIKEVGLALNLNKSSSFWCPAITVETMECTCQCITLWCLSCQTCSPNIIIRIVGVSCHNMNVELDVQYSLSHPTQWNSSSTSPPTPTTETNTF